MPVVQNVRTAATLELDIDVDTLKPQDSGSREAASIELDLYDPDLTFDLLPEDEIVVALTDPADPFFGGHVRSLVTDIIATGRKYHLVAYDYSTLLDRINVVSIDRPAGESDHARLAYFMTTFGAGLLDATATGIATLRASMPAQKFRAVTLRQAIEQILGTALSTGTYRLNALKRLDTWDSSPGLAAAPFNIVVAAVSGGGELAPENLSITADTSNVYNAYWVRGATAAGSGWFTDPASILQWGKREKFIDAPDSDLAWKAYNVGHAALADTAQPKYRGTFTVYDGDWGSNQRFALTSPMHGPTPVGFVAEPFDTVRVTRRYLDGTGTEAIDVEFGSPAGSFAAKTGKEARRSDGVGPGSGGLGGFPGGFPVGGVGGGGGAGGTGTVVAAGDPAGKVLGYRNGPEYFPATSTLVTPPLGYRAEDPDSAQIVAFRDQDSIYLSGSQEPFEFNDIRRIATWTMPAGTTGARIRGRMAVFSHNDVGEGPVPMSGVISWALAMTSWDETGSPTDAGAWTPNGRVLLEGTTAFTLSDTFVASAPFDLWVPASEGPFQLHLLCSSSVVSAEAELTATLPITYDFFPWTFVDGTVMMADVPSVGFGGEWFWPGNASVFMRAPAGELNVLSFPLVEAIINGGATVGPGGDCGCPPFTGDASCPTDSFGRDVAAGWGTADSMNAWTDGDSVAANRGVIAATSFATAMASLPTPTPFSTMTFVARIDNAAAIIQAELVFGDGGTILVRLTDGTPPPYVECFLEYDDHLGNNWSGNLPSSRPETILNADLTCRVSYFADDSIYGPAIRIRVWDPSTEPEPTGWDFQLVSTAVAMMAPITGDLVTTQLGLQGASGVVTAEFSGLDVAGAPGFCTPDVGQQVPRKQIGTGDGTTTTFYTTGPFKTGSLEADIDGQPVTPTTQTPIAGSFVLGTAPVTGEKVYAAWRAA